MLTSRRSTNAGSWTFVLGVGAATAAAHIGNNFTTYLIGGLMDGFGFTPVQMAAWSMVETLSYAAAMFLVAPRVTRLSPRLLMVAAGVLVAVGQAGSAFLTLYPLLLMGRVMTGVGFGLANSALNLAAGRGPHPARAISIGIAVQTGLYALINIGLPMVGARHGVAGMFYALAGLSAVFTLAAGWLPPGPGVPPVRSDGPAHAALGTDGVRVLAAMASFTLGSLAIWPFMERAAHAIGMPAVIFGRYQSAATLLSAVGNLTLAAVVSARPRLTWPLTCALVVCACACAALTRVVSWPTFALALITFNVSWFLCYPLLLGIAYSVDGSGRLAVLCSAAWLLMMSLGSLVTGVLVQWLGDYRDVGPLGMVICLFAAVLIWPLARRMDGRAMGLRWSRRTRG